MESTNLNSFSAELYHTPRVIHASIHDLPTELLVRIFYFATEFRYSNLTLKVATEMLLSLCCVSRHWRAVVSSIPRIWGRLMNIMDFSGDQVLRVIERSRSSPIELFLDGEQPNINLTGVRARLSRVLLELDRISYLVIRRFHLSPNHFHLLCRPASLLDLFSFEGCGLDPVRLPALLFSNNAPRLRSLRLSSALIDFDKASFPQLREIHIRDIRHPFPPSLSAWLVFLSKHASITSLNLSYAISIRFSDAYEWLPDVHLTQLQELTLSDDATSCARLLARIRAPDTCKISVITGLDSHQGVQLLRASLATLASPRVAKHLQVAFTGISVAFTSMVDNPSSSEPESSLFFKFQWQTKFDPFEDLRLSHNPLDFLPANLLSCIESLRLVLLPIDGRYPLQDALLRSELGEWLRNFTLVERLVVDSCPLDALLDLLSDDYDVLDADESENSQTRPIFPSLRDLEVIRTQEEELDWEAVMSFAEWRSDVGHRMKHVTVPGEEMVRLSGEDGAILADLDLEIILR